MNLEYIMLNNVSQPKKDKYCISLTGESKNIKLVEVKWWLLGGWVVCKGCLRYKLAVSGK